MAHINICFGRIKLIILLVLCGGAFWGLWSQDSNGAVASKIPTRLQRPLPRDFLMAVFPERLAEKQKKAEKKYKKELSRQKLYDALELRYEARQLDFMEHELEVRLKPVAWGERGARKKRATARYALRQFSNEEKPEKRMQKRLERLLELRAHLAEKQYWVSLKELEEKRSELLLSLSASEQFSPEDLLQSQQKLLEADREIMTLSDKLKDDQNDILGMKTGMQLDTSVVVQWGLGDLAFPGEKVLSQRVQNILGTPDSLFPDYEKNRLQVSYAKTQLELEEKRATQTLSFIKAGYKLEIPEYSDEAIDYSARRWYAGFGLSLPWGDGRADDIRTREQDLEDAQQEVKNDLQDLRRDLEDLTGAFQTLERQYVRVQNYLLSLEQGKVYQVFESLASSNPLLGFKAHQARLEAQKDLRRIEEQMLNIYADMLKQSGQTLREMQSNPLF